MSRQRGPEKGVSPKGAAAVTSIGMGLVVRALGMSGLTCEMDGSARSTLGRCVGVGAAMTRSEVEACGTWIVTLLRSIAELLVVSAIVAAENL